MLIYHSKIMFIPEMQEVQAIIKQGGVSEKIHICLRSHKVEIRVLAVLGFHLETLGKNLH